MNKIALLTFLLTVGCTDFRGFQPPPANFFGWAKLGASHEDVKNEMLKCGYDNPYQNPRNETINVAAEHQICMFNNGYKFKSGYKGICYASQNWQNIPACVEYRKTH